MNDALIFYIKLVYSVSPCLCVCVCVKNVPQIVVQCFSAANDDWTGITILSMIFSAISVIGALITQVSRRCSQQSVYSNAVCYDLSLKLESEHFDYIHRLCHKRFAQSIAAALDTSEQRIEVYSVTMCGTPSKLKIDALYTAIGEERFQNAASNVRIHGCRLIIHIFIYV